MQITEPPNSSTRQAWRAENSVDDISPGTFGVLAACLLYAALWIVATPYFGLNHDAQGYAASGLIHLQAQPLSGDLFFRFRSQDEFSIFPALYGWFIGWLGLEHAAAGLCALMQLAWFAVAGLLASTLLGPRLGLLALGLLVALPQPYGGQRVFHLVEPFMTARLPAEVVSLLAVLLFIKGQRAWSVAACVFAMLLHPLMAFPAVLLVAFMQVWAWVPRKGTMAVTAGIISVVAVGGAVVLGGDAPVMGGQWLAVTKIRSGFLFLDGWQPEDWNHTLQSLMTLLLATRVLAGTQAARLATAAFWLGVAGLLLTALISYVLPLNVLVQGQPWRWLWPARIVATIALPAVLIVLWRGSTVERAVSLFLAAGSLLFINRLNASLVSQLSPAMLIAASGGLWLARNRIDARSGTLLVRAGAAVLAAVMLAATLRTAGAVGLATSGGRNPGWLDSVRAIGSSVVPVALGAFTAWVLCTRSTGTLQRGLLAAAGCIALALLGPPALAQWRAERFPESARAAFDSWRILVPEQAEVLWLPDQLQETWFLLNRRSYLSRSQSGGVVYSPELTSEIVRRAMVLAPIVDRGYWILEPGSLNAKPKPLSAEALMAVCEDPELGFVVSDDNIGRGVARMTFPTTGVPMVLYDCADFRGGGGR